MGLRDTILPSCLHNTTAFSSKTFLISLGFTASPWERISLLLFHGSIPGPYWLDGNVMFLFHDSIFLSILILLLYLFSFLLCKLFSFLYRRAASRDHNGECVSYEEKKFLTVSDEPVVKEDLIADVLLGGESLLFWHKNSECEDTFLVEQGKNSDEKTLSCEVHDSFGLESAYGTSLEDLHEEKLGTDHGDIAIGEALIPSDCPPPVVSSSDAAAFNDENLEVEARNDTEENGFLEEKRFSVGDHSGRKKFELDGFHGVRHHYDESLAGESTSKSSIEWRGSKIFQDSEMEYPFSSSSRKSSSSWESYTMFRKYDEDMLFFDRISMQKLHETESLRSIRLQPRSISQGIVHKLITKHKQFPRGSRNPYKELENAYVAQICLIWEALNWKYNNFHRANADKHFPVLYVAQICLTWEALNWKYNNFHRANADKHTNESGCPARVAQQFQKFQVVLQRFIENEPYEHGRRPEAYARMRITSPKLLQVPEFRDSEDDESKEDMTTRISSEEFLKILEDSIRTIMNFLTADKESHCEMLRALIRKQSSSVDQTYINLIKKANKKKKMRLKDLARRRKCFGKRKLEGAQEIRMGLIDMKVVSRVLRMAEISEEQLHWCEEKMNKLRIWDGKIQRDSSPLFFSLCNDCPATNLCFTIFILPLGCLMTR